MLTRWISEVLAKQLAEYLVIKPGDAQLELLSRKVQLVNVQIRPEAINSSLDASPLLLCSGSISLLQIHFRPLVADAIHVVLDGLSLELKPRPSDSDWWAKKSTTSDDQQRASRLAALDPEVQLDSWS
eukprot:jgi/Mesen1/6960/ME000360S06228